MLTSFILVIDWYGNCRHLGKKLSETVTLKARGTHHISRQSTKKYFNRMAMRRWKTLIALQTFLNQFVGALAAYSGNDGKG
jgi:hypothetical protein